MGILVTTFGIVGVSISGYVWYKQVTTGPVLCVGDGCAKVIRSPYGRLLSIPNGALGVAYFGGVAAASVLARVVSAAGLLLAAATAATAVALVLYAYLTYLQFAVLRAWCVWCLSSAALTLGILLALLAR